MKLTNFLKAKPTDKGGAEFDAALDQILKIEAKKNEAEKALESARRILQEAQAAEIEGSGDGSGVADPLKTVVAQNEAVASLDRLLRQANDAAIGMIAAVGVSAQQRLTEVETLLAETRRQIDTRKITRVAEFARKHNLRVSWPSKNTAGAIHLPAMTVGSAEAEAIARDIKVMVDVDPDAGKLDKLAAERNQLAMLTRSQPNVALDSLLAERRRR